MAPNHSSAKLQAWFEALTGDPAGTRSVRPLPKRSDELGGIALEGALIRRVLVERQVHVASEITLSTPDAHRAQRDATLLRARQAGVFLRKKAFLRALVDIVASIFVGSPQGPSSTAPQRGNHSMVLTRVGVAGAFGLILFVLYLASRPVALTDGYPDGVVMRGDEQAQRLTTANPVLLADQCEAVLRQEGAQMRRFSAGPAIVIQAKIPNISSAGRARLLALGAVVPGHGRLHLQIEGQQASVLNK